MYGNELFYSNILSLPRSIFEVNKKYLPSTKRKRYSFAKNLHEICNRKIMKQIKCYRSGKGRASVCTTMSCSSLYNTGGNHHRHVRQRLDSKSSANYFGRFMNN